jgi:hypothetical protein
VSTKAMRELAMTAKSAWRGSPRLEGIADKALAEVEAIEAAAKHYVTFEDMAGAPDDIMESIARDAP